jgi:hypothetical protein
VTVYEIEAVPVNPSPDGAVTAYVCEPRSRCPDAAGNSSRWNRCTTGCPGRRFPPYTKTWPERAIGAQRLVISRGGDRRSRWSEDQANGLVDRRAAGLLVRQSDGVADRRLRYSVGTKAGGPTAEHALPTADNIDADHVSRLDSDVDRIVVELAIARIGLVAGIAQNSILIAAQRTQHLEVVGARRIGARARLRLEAWV